jgi:glycolate oxidase FAD binding subunit
MNSAAISVASRLAAIVSGEQVIDEPAQLTSYAVGGKTPTAVARPGSADEAVEILKFAAAENLAIIATGARTKLTVGNPPHRYDLALDMTRLDRVDAYDPGDLTLSVEAGIPLRKIADVLSTHRQFLPLTPSFRNRSTVGGAIASGMDSPLRQFYGTARDYILGMEFITGQGTLAKSGGRVVKNVAGYDLHKLMIGALGTLGVITKINFRTFPQPAPIRGFVATFSSAHGALDMRHRVSRSPLTPLTLEILSPGGAGLLSGDAAARIEPGPLPPNLISSAQWTFTASFAGSDSVLGRYECDLRRMAEESGAADAAAIDPEHTTGLLDRIREFAPIALESSPSATILKIAVLPTQVEEILEATAGAAETNALAWAALARGCGVIYLALLPRESSEETRHATLRAVDRILAQCDGCGGNFSIPWCPAEWRRELKAWPTERGDSAQMEKLKKVFDPHGILSPGRFVGGL